MTPQDSKVGLVRKIAALVLAVAVVGSLASCSDIPAQVQGCSPQYKSGAASDSISAKGTFGANPEAKVPTPTLAKTVQVTTAKKGSGLELGPGDIARIQLSLYFSKSGALVGSSGDTTDPSTGGTVSVGDNYSKAGALQAPVGSKKTAIFKALECETVGSRVVTVMTASDYFGSDAAAKAQNVTPSTGIVAVMDIIKGYRGRATGTLAPLQSGFPSVVTSGNGTPGLTLDLQEPPKTATHEVVRAGSGAKIKAGQTVLLQVQAIAWTDPAPKTTFDSTWTTNSPRFYKLTALTANAAGYSLDAASVKALVGQRVGSQVMVVVPPKYGYPSGKAPSGYPTKETLIFVYDILGVY